MRWTYRLVSALLVLTSIIGISFALYLEHVQGLEPCPLCIFQRIGLIGMGLIALVAFIHNPISNGFKRFYALLATLSIGWSVGVAARHVWLQHLPPDKVAERVSGEVTNHPTGPMHILQDTVAI